MIQLDKKHPALDQIMRQRMLPNPEQRLPDLRVDAVDFDNVVYHCTAARNSTDLTISVKVAHWDVLRELGVTDHLNSVYSQYNAAKVEEGYDLTYNFSGLKGEDAEKAIECFSKFYTEMLSAIFIYGVKHKVGPTAVPLRDHFQCYMAQSGGNFVVVFGLEDTDDDLRRIKRVFLQEMSDVKKDPSLNGCPQARFSEPDQVPAEITSLKPKVDRKHHCGWLTVTLFTRQTGDDAILKQAATQLAYFYPYLQYHIKCSLAYVHYCERARFAKFLTVLNRARPDPKAQ